MKTLKTILYAIYPIIIILLLLNLTKCGNNTNHRVVTPPAEDTVNRIADIPVDTVAIVDSVVESSVDTVNTDRVVRQAREIGKTGALKVTLLWNFEGDIDVHVKQPNGRTIWYKDHADPSTGGYLDVDNQSGGRGSAENVYWEKPPKGNYTISLVYYDVSLATGNAGKGTCTVVVFQEGKNPMTYKVPMKHVKEAKQVVTLQIL